MSQTVDEIQELSTELPPFRINVCGPFQVKYWDGASYQPVPASAWRGSHDPRRLLKVLLCSPRRKASRARLQEILWPDSDHQTLDLDDLLNDAAYRLRKALQPTKGTESLLLTTKDPNCYALVGQDRLWVDADAALALLEQAEERERQGGDALPLLEEAGNLLDQGEFLEDYQHSWTEGRCRTVADARHRCGLWRARLYEKRGEMHKAEFLLRLFLEENALDEDVLCALMLNLHRQKRTWEGLRLYEETRALLECRGMTPTETTKTMWRQLRGDA